MKKITLLLLFAASLGCRRDEVENKESPAYQLTQSESLTIPAAVDLPPNAPGGYTRVATFYAEGVQRYKAQAKAGSNPLVYEWVFVAPEATLYDASNRKVGTHGAGPHWQLSPTDSIFAQAFVPARSAPSPDTESIDWLLLKSKTGTTPTGVFKDVSYVQRIATKGGKPPVIPPTTANETTEIKYRAVYRFSKINP